MASPLLLLSLPLLLLLVVLYTVYTIPHWFTELLAHTFPRVLFFAPQPSPRKPLPKLIALTIDDSVDPSITKQVCELLRSHGAKATFFIIGQYCDSVEGKQLLEELVREGHELGNHTWLDRPSWKLDQEQLAQEMQAVDLLIQQAYSSAASPDPAGASSSTPLKGPSDPPAPGPGPSCKWFRPGHGFFTDPMLHTAERLGYRTVLGNVYPHDPWVSSWRLNSWMVLQRAQPGAILVLHDGRPWLIPTLRELLPRLAARGYRLVTLSQLMQQYA